MLRFSAAGLSSRQYGKYSCSSSSLSFKMLWKCKAVGVCVLGHSLELEHVKVPCCILLQNEVSSAMKAAVVTGEMHVGDRSFDSVFWGDYQDASANCKTKIECPPIRKRP